MRKLILLLSIAFLAGSIYSAMQDKEQWTEKVLKKIRYQGVGNSAGAITGGVDVLVTKDYSQLSNVFLFASLLGFAYVFFKQKE